MKSFYEYFVWRIVFSGSYKKLFLFGKFVFWPSLGNLFWVNIRKTFFERKKIVFSGKYRNFLSGPG